MRRRRSARSCRGGDRSDRRHDRRRRHQRARPDGGVAPRGSRCSSTRVISVTEARRAVNLNVVLTIAMSISLGTAVAVSGLAAEMADLLGNGSAIRSATSVACVAVLVATMILTELLSNNAAAALDAPGGHGDRRRCRARPTIVRDRGADRGVVFVPVADRLPDQPDGVRPRRLPVPRLHSSAPRSASSR